MQVAARVGRRAVHFRRGLHTEASDFLVIGSGIAGASAAYNIARQQRKLRPSARVTILEREDQPGYHSTGRSAALFAETYGSPSIRALTTGSKAELLSEELRSFADGVPFLKDLGLFWIGRKDQLEILGEHFRATGRLVKNLRYTRDKGEILRTVPILNGDYVAEAFSEPDAADMDVSALHNAFLKGARQAGAQLHLRAEVAKIERTSAGGDWLVHTSDGRVFRSPVLVNAAGAWADEVAKLAGIATIGLMPKVRTCINFEAPDEVASLLPTMPMVFDCGEELYFKPDAGKILASPADETPSEPCDAQPDELDVAICVDRLEQATTLRVRRITHKWAGLRSFVADKNLVIGPDTQESSFIWCAGQGGYGIQTSPAAGRLVAAAAAGQKDFIPGDLLELLGEHAGEISPSRPALARSKVSA